MKKLLGALIFTLCSFTVTASPVNINSADAQAIADALPGIGLKKAEAIVKYRKDIGPFQSAEDLVNVNGIGEKILAKIKNDILLSDDEAATIGQ